MLIFPNLETFSVPARVAKYLFGLITAGLTIFSLLNEVTLKEADAEGRKKLTSAGRLYLRWFVALAVATALMTWLGDSADDRKKRVDAETLAKQEAGHFEGLAATMEAKLQGLNTQIDGSNQRIAASQKKLLHDTQVSATKVTALQGAVVKANTRTLEATEEAGVLTREAELPLRRLWMKVELPPNSRGMRAAPTEGHGFAEALYTSPDASTQIAVTLSNFELNLYVAACRNGPAGAQQPCLKSIQKTPTGHDDDKAGDVSADGRLSVLTIFPEVGGGAYLARDAEMRGVTVWECVRNQSTPPKTKAAVMAELQTAVRRAPKSLEVSVIETLDDGHASRAGDARDLSHTHRYMQTEWVPEMDGYCVKSAYVP